MSDFHPPLLPIGTRVRIVVGLTLREPAYWRLGTILDVRYPEDRESRHYIVKIDGNDGDLDDCWDCSNQKCPFPNLTKVWSRDFWPLSVLEEMAEV